MKPIFFLVFTLTAIHAQTGHWTGVIQLPAGEIAIQVDLATDPSGKLYGSFSSPAQQLVGFPLSDLGVQGRDVYFQIKGTPGNRSFVGGLSPDNQSMAGEFKQGQFSLHFLLSRSGDPHVTPAPKLSPVPKELEGTWTGSAEVSGQPAQLVLNLANQADGSASGTIHTLSDDLEIPISALKQTPSGIAFELQAIGGAINAKLVGSELSGTYTQGSTTFPVTFRRK
jgi:hypothetical protein